MTQNLHRELKYQVLHLVCWPSMSQMLDATGADIARICALLARRPSVGILIPVMLNLSPEQTFSLLKALHASGNICSVAVPDCDAPDPLHVEPPVCCACAADTSFIAKLWHRLMEKT